MELCETVQTVVVPALPQSVCLLPSQYTAALNVSRGWFKQLCRAVPGALCGTAGSNSAERSLLRLGQEFDCSEGEVDPRVFRTSSLDVRRAI